MEKHGIVHFTQRIKQMSALDPSSSDLILPSVVPPEFLKNRDAEAGEAVDRILEEVYEM